VAETKHRDGKHDFGKTAENETGPPEAPESIAKSHNGNVFKTIAGTR